MFDTRLQKAEVIFETFKLDLIARHIDIFMSAIGNQDPIKSFDIFDRFFRAQVIRQPTAVFRGNNELAVGISAAAAKPLHDTAAFAGHAFIGLFGNDRAGTLIDRASAVDNADFGVLILFVGAVSGHEAADAASDDNDIIVFHGLTPLFSVRRI